MATVRYIGPSIKDVDGRELGAVSVPLLGRDIEPDEVVDVPDEYLEDYAWPEELWDVHASSDDPRTVKELRAELVERSLPTTGNKPDLIERLAQAPAGTTDTTTDGE